MYNKTIQFIFLLLFFCNKFNAQNNSLYSLSVFTSNNKVNNLAKERFEQEFYKKFPKGSVSINTSNGEYSFEYFKFETNYTMYHVYFRNVNGKIPEILEFLANSQNHNGEDAIWIPRNNYNVKIMDQESINKVKQLLKYNTVWKKWKEKTQRRETPTDIA